MLTQVDPSYTGIVAQNWIQGKIKILLLSIHYPFAIKNYFEKALQHRLDVELITCGPYTYNHTPWMGGMTLPMKYAVPPDIILPFPPNIGAVDYEYVKSQLPQGWIPDLVLTIDAGIHWKNKPTDGKVAHVATDPHVLNYDFQRTISDEFFNMQLYYSKSGDIYLPYAYSQYDHFPDDTVSKDTDVVLIGMPYPQRVELVNALRGRGVSVIFENGPIFDEARALYNRGRIGLNWSSMNDLNARAFEIAAMKLCPVMNVVPDLHMIFSESMFSSVLQWGEGDYMGFANMDEAIEKIIYMRDRPDIAKAIAEHAYNKVQGQTYDARIKQILEECEFI